jgi:hypothetical protein
MKFQDKLTKYIVSKQLLSSFPNLLSDQTNNNIQDETLPIGSRVQFSDSGNNTTYTIQRISDNICVIVLRKSDLKVNNWQSSFDDLLSKLMAIIYPQEFIN